MKTTEFEIFDNSDARYLAWLQTHPEGYVLNRRRGKSDNYLILHRATCNQIKNYRKNTNLGGFTERNYIKICSNSLIALHDYARIKGGRPDSSFSNRCKSCNPH